MNTFREEDKMELSRKQFDILEVLAAFEEGLSQRELEKKVGLSLGTINKIVQGLVEEGFVLNGKITEKGFVALDRELEAAKTRKELSLIEVKCSIGARDDLGRPTTTALENKENFMEYLRGI